MLHYRELNVEGEEHKYKIGKSFIAIRHEDYSIDIDKAYLCQDCFNKNSEQLY